MLYGDALTVKLQNCKNRKGPDELFTENLVFVHIQTFQRFMSHQV